MEAALAEGRVLAAEAGEVPIGAVPGAWTARSSRADRTACCAQRSNRPRRDREPCARRQQPAGNYRLNGCTLYVTLEPCAMCAGAMIHARLERLVFAAADPKAGACGSVLAVVNHPRLNHQMRVDQGNPRRRIAELLRGFFRTKR